MKQIVKGSALLTAVSLGEMVMRFVRTKCIALVLGPSGTGFLAQLAIFFEALRIWGDLGSRRAVIKQIAEQRLIDGKASPQYKQVVKTSFFLVTLSSLIVGAGIALFSPQISHYLYGDWHYYPFVIFQAFLLPFASLCTVTSSIVKGNLDYSAFAKYTLIAYLAVVFLTPVLVYCFHYWGALVSQGLFFLLPLLAYLILNARKRFLHFSKEINLSALKEQFSYGFLQIYQDSLTHLIRLVIAAWIIHDLGLSQMGIYQVVTTFTTVYMAVPIQAMSGYTFPLIAASKDSHEVNLAVNDSLRFLMFVLVPVILLLMILPEFFITLFYSADFIQAVPVLQIQLFSTLFILMSYSYTGALIAKGKLKCIFLISTVYPVIFCILARLFFSKWGLLGIAIASALSSFANYAAHDGFARYYFGFKLVPKNMKLVLMTYAWAALAFAGMIYYDRPGIRILLSLFGVIWFMVSSKGHERRFLRERLMQLFRRKEFAKKPV